MTTTLPANRRSMSGAHLALGADSTQAWGTMTEDEGLKALLGGDAAAAARAETALWEMWHRSGDREVDTLLREGVAVMERRDLAGAEAIFARVIARAPEFAEGWNKRATVRYVAENYEGSIDDCEETLKRKPHHFGRHAHAAPARRHDLPWRHQRARAELRALLDHGTVENDRADADAHVVHDPAGVDDRAMADRDVVADDAREFGCHVQHRVVL